MKNIQNSLKQLSRNGQIAESAALSVGSTADGLLSRSVELLTALKGQVGEYHREQIDTHVASITGVKSKDMVYFFEKEPDGQ